jgi:hypothetical protein
LVSERIQRRIERLLDEADEAVGQLNWQAVRDRAEAVLALDPGNADALTFIAAADRSMGSERTADVGDDAATARPSTSDSESPLPTSLVSGRYEVKRFLGEGGKKKVYLAHDTTLDRDVAFALIKTEGLDEASRTRITREAQTMGRLGDHPNIVQIHDLGEENGQPYMVLPLMSGGDVEGLIEKADDHRLPPGTDPGDSLIGVPGTGVRPLQGHRPPGPEAGQRVAHIGGSGQNRGLWPGSCD